MRFNWKSAAAGTVGGLVVGLAYGFLAQDDGVIVSTIVFTLFGFGVSLLTMQTWFDPAAPAAPAAAPGK